MTVDVPQIWDFFAKRPRNLCEICCVFDDSAAIIKWGAMEKVHRRWGIRLLGLKPSATARRVAPWSLCPTALALTRPHTGQASPRGCYRTVVHRRSYRLWLIGARFLCSCSKNDDGLTSPLFADAPIRFLQNRRTDAGGGQGRRLLSPGFVPTCVSKRQRTA
jgi:hypothetical protein